jgi:uncharacterized membrane protein
MMDLNMAHAQDFEKIVMVLAFALVAFALYYYWFNKKARKRSSLQAEFEEILNSDKYKVKGKFETER